MSQDEPISAATPEARLLVIGYGNPFRGDDGFGALAANLIAERRLDAVEVIVSRQLTPEMAIPLSRARFAIFLDAAVGDHPGKLCLTCVAPDDTPGRSHFFAPGTLLALAKVVFGHAPPAALITATAATLEQGTEITPGVRAAANAAAEAVAALAAAEAIDGDLLASALSRAQAGGGMPSPLARR